MISRSVAAIYFCATEENFKRNMAKILSNIEKYVILRNTLKLCHSINNN